MVPHETEQPRVNQEGLTTARPGPLFRLRVRCWGGRRERPCLVGHCVPASTKMSKEGRPKAQDREAGWAFLGCPSTSPQTGWLRTMEVRPLSVLETRRPFEVSTELHSL